MDRLLLDVSVVVNLFAGGVLRSLTHEAGMELLVVERMTSERLQVEDDGEPGEVLVWETLIASGTLVPISPSGAEELKAFLGLVPRLGDQEAAALAAARHHNLVLATDDPLTRDTAAHGNPSVATITTPDVVSWWRRAVSADVARVAGVISRIEERARFRPARDHPLASWWANTASPVP